jgi:hypothetical protein
MAAGAPSKYVTIVHHVKEVSVFGQADLAYWQRYLAREGLTAYDDLGRAQLLLIAADMVWNGARFTELSVSVAVAGAGPDQLAGMYCIQAFNSIRVFAWVERTFFQTPYYHARTTVSPTPPIGFALEASGATLLRAARVSSAPPAARGPETFAGPVYLPSALTRTPRTEKVFYAELTRQTDVFPFAPEDTLSLTPSPRAPVVGWLHESGFAGTAWHVRPDAVHKKSHTVPAPAQRTPAAA